LAKANKFYQPAKPTQTREHGEAARGRAMGGRKVEKEQGTKTPLIVNCKRVKVQLILNRKIREELGVSEKGKGMIRSRPSP